MKKLKKLAALVLAAAMVLAMGMTSFAAGENGTITIGNAGKYAVDGVTFKAYKVFDVTTNDSGGYGYAMTEQVKRFFAELGTSITTDNEAYEYVKENAGAFRDALAADIAADTDSAIYTSAATIDSVNTASPQVDYGFYIIVPTKEGKLYKEISPNLVYVGQENVAVELKGEKPTVEKKVDGKEYTNGQVGDKVTFTLTSKVPDMSSYEADSYVFKFTDTLSKGLKVDTSSVTVTVGSKNYKTDLLGTVAVTTEPESSDGSQQTTMIIDLKEFAKLCADMVGQEIKVTYKAEITDDVHTTNVAPNTVQINYGNNGEDVGGGDTANTWLYHLEIKKVDDKQQALPGAEFEIYTSSDGTTKGEKLKLIKVADGNYRVATPTEISDSDSRLTTTVVSPRNGIIIVRGLETGKYIVHETKAPDGYNRATEDYTLNVKPTTDDNGATITYPGKENEVTIKNHKGSLLPDTGGMGTVVFTVIGLVLILGVGASFVISRKKRA